MTLSLLFMSPASLLVSAKQQTQIHSVIEWFRINQSELTISCADRIYRVTETRDQDMNCSVVTDLLTVQWSFFLFFLH